MKAVVHTMGPEQFLGMFLSAGVFSSAARYFSNSMIFLNIISNIFKYILRDVSPSLGASGAIWGMLTSLAFLYPDMQLAIIFLPFFTFTAASVSYLIIM